MGSGGGLGDFGRSVGKYASVVNPTGILGAASGVGDKIGKAVGDTWGKIGDSISGKRQEGDNDGLKSIQDAALQMYGESSGEYGGQSENRANFAQQLADRALGKAPSIAGAQMRQAQDRNLSQQVAAAKANRAVNPALLARQTARLGAEGNQQIAQASGIAGLQEQNQNQSAYQNYLNQIQNSRFSALGAGSGAAQGISAANAANAASQNAFTGQLIGTAGSIGAMALMSDRNAKTKIKKEGSENNLESLSDANEKVDVVRLEGPRKDFKTALAELQTGSPLDGVENSILKGASMAKQMSASKSGASSKPNFASALSDRTKKDEVSKANDGQEFSPKSFLDKLQAYSYEYKDPTLPGTSPGRHLSVMAQDLEKAGPVGQSMVKETPNGKIVDYGKGFGAMLAAQADMNARLGEIETRYGKKK